MLGVCPCWWISMMNEKVGLWQCGSLCGWILCVLQPLLGRQRCALCRGDTLGGSGPLSTEASWASTQGCELPAASTDFCSILLSLAKIKWGQVWQILMQRMFQNGQKKKKRSKCLYEKNGKEAVSYWQLRNYVLNQSNRMECNIKYIYLGEIVWTGYMYKCKVVFFLAGRRWVRLLGRCRKLTWVSGLEFLGLVCMGGGGLIGIGDFQHLCSEIGLRHFWHCHQAPPRQPRRSSFPIYCWDYKT